MLVDLCKEVFDHTVNNHNDIDQFKALVRDLSNVTFQTKQANKFKFLQLKIIIKNFQNQIIDSVIKKGQGLDLLCMIRNDQIPNMSKENSMDSERENPEQFFMPTDNHLQDRIQLDLDQLHPDMVHPIDQNHLIRYYQPFNQDVIAIPQV